MAKRLEGKVAVITGGSSGIGLGTVDRFIDEGAKVVCADIQDDKGANMEQQYGDSFAYVHCDVSEEADVAMAVGLAKDRFGRLDCIFNNAGMGGVLGEIQETDADGMDHTLNVLFKGVVYGMKHAAKIMIEQGSGSIINTASVAALSGGFGPHVYSGCKAAVAHMSRSVALEVGKHGIRVNAICPGGIATSIFGAGMGLPIEQADKTAKAMESVLAQLQPIKRSGMPDDIANMALFLASDESTFVSGQSIAVDGALTTGREAAPVDEGGLAAMVEALTSASS